MKVAKILRFFLSVILFQGCYQLTLTVNIKSKVATNYYYQTFKYPKKITLQSASLAIQKADSIEPNNFEILLRKGELLNDSGLYKEAVIVFNRALELPSKAKAKQWCYYVRAVAYINQNNWTLACEDWERAGVFGREDNKNYCKHAKYHFDMDTTIYDLDVYQPLIESKIITINSRLCNDTSFRITASKTTNERDTLRVTSMVTEVDYIVSTLTRKGKIELSFYRIAEKFSSHTRVGTDTIKKMNFKPAPVIIVVDDKNRLYARINYTNCKLYYQENREKELAFVADSTGAKYMLRNFKKTNEISGFEGNKLVSIQYIKFKKPGMCKISDYLCDVKTK